MSSRFSRPVELVRNAVVPCAILLLFGSVATITADPGAASFALGGLQFKKEPRISMMKETLSFDDESGEFGLEFRVTAEYEFQNNTNQPVTIPIAFPLPDELCGAANSPYLNFAEGRFHVWVEAKETKYATETRAFRSQEYIPTSTKDLGKDYTRLLGEFGIVPESCKTNPSLSHERTMQLVALGLLDKESNNANWTARRKYYWTQTFPASRTTHVKIQYPAQMGYSDVYLGKGWDKGLVKGTAEFWKAELTNTCGGAALEKKVTAELSRPDGFAKVYWLDFALVTANYWNGPIKDFVLTVHTSNPHTSFCWDEPIKRTDATHLVATASDFSPKRDLHIGFVEVF